MKIKNHHRWWVSIQSLLLVIIAISGPLWRGQWPLTVSASLGGIFFLFAAWSGLLGVAHLGRNRTPSPVPIPGSKLVTTGIYARMRHPLYASMMAMGLGWACFWSSIITLGIAAGFLVFLHAKARFEERLLRATFETYPEYAARVPRYFPSGRRA